MSKLIIKSGKGDLVLRKSQSLVGLKRSADADKLELPEDTPEVINNLGGFQVFRLPESDKGIDEKLDEVRAADATEVGTHVYFAEGSNQPLIATGEIFVIFEAGVGLQEQEALIATFHLALVERRSADQIVVRVTPDSPNPFKVAHALQALSPVKMAEPDIDTPLTSYAEQIPPSDDLWAHQWHLNNEGRVPDAPYYLKRGADARVLHAWKRMGNMGSSQVVVAVIDDGFDLNHPDLQDKVYKPFDLLSQSSRIPQGDPRFTHGTPCASVALAASNGRGIIGVAPHARFMPVNGTSFSVRATEQMFDYCVRQGADIISCSWGTTELQYSLNAMKEEAIAKAVREGRNGKGCIVLFAAGNENLDFLNFYAAHPDVIAVGACTSRDEHAYYSNRGRELSVVAPSNGDWPITAARASWDAGVVQEQGVYKFWRDGRSRGDYYKHFGGTSCATPIVAGVCALMLSVNPDLTAAQVKGILQQTADKIGFPGEYVNGHSRKYGYGRVNADRAVAEALRLRDKAGSASASVAGSVGSGQGLFKIEVTTASTSGWGVQTGAFSSYANVLVEVERLERQFGYPVLVNISESNGTTLYKIIVGSFQAKSDAEQLLSRLRAVGKNGFVRSLSDL